MKKFLNKKIIIIASSVVILVAAIVVLLCIVLSRGNDPIREVFSRGDFDYTIRDDGRIEIVAYRGSDKNVVVPSVIEGKTVASIGNEVFLSSELRSVTLGSFVESIGAYAFGNSVHLYEVVFPDSLVSIGVGAFYGCEVLEEIDLPENLASISDYAFLGCEIVESVTFPESLTEIGNKAFAECHRLSEIKILSKNL